MRKTRKILAMLLALVMVAVCTATAAFAYNEKLDVNKDGQVVYTVLGDSIPAGWSCAGFVEWSKEVANWPIVPGTYPELVKNQIGADKVNMDAHIGLRSTDLRYLLCDDYAGDIAVGWRVPTTDKYRTVDLPGLQKVRTEFQNDVKEADVITLGIGINDLTIPSGILDNVQDENKDILMSELGSLTNLQTVWGDTLNNAYQLADNATYMAQVTTLLFGFYRNYCSNLDAIVQRIYELNPTVKLYVIGYYNAAQDAYAKGALPVDIGALVTPLIDLFNSHAANNAATYGYTYVKMEHIDTLFCDPTSAGYLNDNHPTMEGHKQMADIISSAILS